MIAQDFNFLSQYIMSARKELWNGQPTSELGFRKVDFSFPDGSEVFVEASLDAGLRGVTALYGPNGRGKTTALRLLAGYHESQRGKIFPESERRRLSFSGADGGDLPPYARCRDIMKRSLSESPRQTNDQDLLRNLGLGDSGNRRVKTLSSGQRKRLSLFRALISGRDGILLDEPLSHLDIISQQALLEIVLLVKPKVPVVVATHSPLIADRLVDEPQDSLYWVDGYKPSGGDGSIIRLGSARELEKRTKGSVQ